MVATKSLGPHANYVAGSSRIRRRSFEAGAQFICRWLLASPIAHPKPGPIAVSASGVAFDCHDAWINCAALEKIVNQLRKCRRQKKAMPVQAVHVNRRSSDDDFRRIIGECGSDACTHIEDFGFAKGRV